MESNLRKRGNPPAITSAVVAFNVRRIRRELGLDLAALSRRLEDVGRPTSVPALSRLENNDRRVDVDDLMALAVVLEVNPNALLFQPTVVGGHYVDLTGAPEIDAGTVWEWAAGERPLRPARLPANARDLSQSLKDFQEAYRHANELEAEKFRARVSPGAPEKPGPGVHHLVRSDHQDEPKRGATRLEMREIPTEVPSDEE